LALANKESLVLAGEFLMAQAAKHNAQVIPIDSEHSGLFQLLEGRDSEAIRRLVITASGGPFRGRQASELADVTPEQALNHPIWPMGPRITVDSATLFNKGMEVIETHHLFGTPLDAIHVYVHPQAIVHAMIDFVDGSSLAQMSVPDMLTPVQYAMTYPDRLFCKTEPLDLAACGQLTFEQPNLEAFPALSLAYEAARQGGTAPTAMNAADEIAVEAFLNKRLSFTGIVKVIDSVLQNVGTMPADSLGAVDEADREARAKARELIGSA
jgi:1-deoxy-D-xylulose-5-phosphate reductoisomerase